jgi:glycosyltransferase involved in cell wall biosynthesis
MVVPEAMSVGVPVLASDRVGAKCIIERHPPAGWVVPFGMVAMREQMLQLIKNRQWLAAASEAALVAAREYTWSAYRARVVETLEAIHKTCAA